MSHNSVDYMTVYRDAAANLSTAVDSSVTHGRGFIDTCVQLDQRMEELNRLAAEVDGVNEALSGLETSLGLSSDGVTKEHGT